VVLEELFWGFNLKNSDKYSVDIYSTGHVEFLKREKKTLWSLQRGKSIEIGFEKI
jgi:hypothetical protein